QLIEATSTLKFTSRDFRLYHIGPRSFIETEEFERVLKTVESGARSPYFKSFTQGATIFPRELWFVEPVTQFMFGVDPTAPEVQTSIRAIERENEDYKDVRVEDKVEHRLLYLNVTGSELLP